MQDQGFALDPEAVRLVDTQLDELLKRITQAKIDLHQLLCELSPVAEDHKVALVFHERGNIFIIDMDDHQHAVLGASEFVDLP